MGLSLRRSSIIMFDSGFVLAKQKRVKRLLFQIKLLFFRMQSYLKARVNDDGHA